MRNLILFFLIMVFCGRTASAQLPGEDDPFFRMTFNKDKRQTMADFLKLSPEESAKFWPIYNDYENERQHLGTERLRLLENYASQYETLSEEETSAMMDELISQQKKLLAIEEKYYKKIKKELSPKKAAAWLQMEEYIITGIRMKIMDSVPFIGEE